MRLYYDDIEQCDEDGAICTYAVDREIGTKYKLLETSVPGHNYSTLSGGSAHIRTGNDEIWFRGCLDSHAAAAAHSLSIKQLLLKMNSLNDSIHSPRRR